MDQFYYVTHETFLLCSLNSYHDGMSWGRMDEGLFMDVALDLFLDAVFSFGGDLLKHGKVGIFDIMGSMCIDVYNLKGPLFELKLTGFL